MEHVFPAEELFVIVDILVSAPFKLRPAISLSIALPNLLAAEQTLWNTTYDP
jgi:hypothetical protein